MQIGQRACTDDVMEEHMYSEVYSQSAIISAAEIETIILQMGQMARFVLNAVEKSEFAKAKLVLISKENRQLER